MNTTISYVPVHGTRLWTGSAFVPGGCARGMKPRPSVVTLGGIDVDNSTGMSAVRCRPR